MNYRSIAEEISSWYFSHLDERASHSRNVEDFLRGPATAVTIQILHPSTTDQEDVTETDAATENRGTSSWRDFLTKENPGKTTIDLEATAQAYTSLSRRSKARLEAFLEGVSLCVTDERKSSNNDSSSKQNGFNRHASSESATMSLVEQGLAGFSVSDKTSSSTILPASLNASSQRFLRTISSGGPKSFSAGLPLQAREGDLTIRLELYLRSIARVRAQQQECVIAAEPARAMKARVRSLVQAFVDTVGTVRQQSPVLTRLLTCLTKELLAIDILGEKTEKTIRRLVVDYEHRTSFASLAFLSSPDDTADHQLTPMVLNYLKYLQGNWKLALLESDIERMIRLCVNKDMRRMLKTIEFHSIGHLLEVCQGLMPLLTNIQIPPGVHGDDHLNVSTDDNAAVQQAIRDLQREVITVNGQPLPPVSSRRDLVRLLSQTMNSRSLTSSWDRKSSSRRSRRSRASGRSLSSDTEGSNLSSGNEADSSVASSRRSKSTSKSKRRRPKFRVTTIDFLTKHLLLAAGRTGVGGDAYFIVRDLFGGDDVEVVPSEMLPTQQRASRSGTIEIIVKLASIQIKCNASFDVYPRSMVGECEPLIQLHTTTSETIALQEVRSSDSNDSDGVRDDLSGDNGEESFPSMMVQERLTERTGWRTLAIRPALYERVEVWSTPS